MKLEKKQKLAQKRKWRIRKTVEGTAEKPRLSVSFSNKHIYAQCIDDITGKTLCSMATTSKNVKSQNILPNVAGAQTLGKELGNKAKSAGISVVVFDRRGRRFHGVVKAFANAAREAGLQF